MTQTKAGTSPITLEKAVALFVDALSGKNRSQATIRAYQTDLSQFLTFLHETNVLMATPPGKGLTKNSYSVRDLSPLQKSGADSLIERVKKKNG
jgi:site-specific recombinase XerD